MYLYIYLFIRSSVHYSIQMSLEEKGSTTKSEQRGLTHFPPKAQIVFKHPLTTRALLHFFLAGRGGGGGITASNLCTAMYSHHADFLKIHLCY